MYFCADMNIIAVFTWKWTYSQLKKRNKVILTSGCRHFQLVNLVLLPSTLGSHNNGFFSCQQPLSILVTDSGLPPPTSCPKFKKVSLDPYQVVHLQWLAGEREPKPDTNKLVGLCYPRKVWFSLAKPWIVEWTWCAVNWSCLQLRVFFIRTQKERWWNELTWSNY